MIGNPYALKNSIFIHQFLVAGAQAATDKEGLLPHAVVVAAGLAACVLAPPVKDDTVLTADPVIGEVACGLGLQRVLDGLGRALVG